MTAIDAMKVPYRVTVTIPRDGQQPVVESSTEYRFSDVYTGMFLDKARLAKESSPTEVITLAGLYRSVDIDESERNTVVTFSLQSCQPQFPEYKP